MNTSEEVWLVICNCPDESVAKQLAERVITEQLAACVNLLPPVQSIYRWQGRIEYATEIPLLIKTCANRYGALEASLRDGHPYDVPEIVALPLAAGLPAYLDWVRTCTH
ncbi:divalent-cation tolerance protein CutA [Chitinilyticum aquatile]|uniref:divalent-cation tolerance protein CutA n=1 Tax=Chitinilyticum aquatile TaxID=362520 RepID=UPI000429846E|nr:divalent-cation tolerance protein CutA [Chitinilyticum aquatile]